MKPQPRLKTTLTEVQKAAIETGLIADFDFEQVRFNQRTGRPIFTLKELQRLTNAMFPNLVSTEIEPTVINEVAETVTVYVVFQLQNGPSIHRNATVRVGEPLFESDDEEFNDAPETVQNSRQAEGIAKYRGWMAAMDGAGFDLTKALLARYSPAVSDDVLNELRGRLISLGKATGFVVGDDWKKFDQLIEYNYNKKFLELSAEEIKTQIGLLSAKLRSQRTQLQQAA